MMMTTHITDNRATEKLKENLLPALFRILSEGGKRGKHIMMKYCVKVEGQFW